MKAAPCSVVQALDGLGTFHHPVISGREDAEDEGFKDCPWSQVLPCGAAASWPLPPPASSRPAFLQSSASRAQGPRLLSP